MFLPMPMVKLMLAWPSLPGHESISSDIQMLFDAGSSEALMQSVTDIGG